MAFFDRFRKEKGDSPKDKPEQNPFSRTEETYTIGGCEFKLSYDKEEGDILIEYTPTLNNQKAYKYIQNAITDMLYRSNPSIECSAGTNPNTDEIVIKVENSNDMGVVESEVSEPPPILPRVKEIMKNLVVGYRDREAVDDAIKLRDLTQPMANYKAQMEQLGQQADALLEVIKPVIAEQTGAEITGNFEQALKNALVDHLSTESLKQQKRYL